MRKLSARNQLKGRIVEVKKGTTTSRVRIDIGGDVIITSSITNEAADLRLHRRERGADGAHHARQSVQPAVRA